MDGPIIDFDSLDPQVLEETLAYFNAEQPTQERIDFQAELDAAVAAGRDWLEILEPLETR